MAQQFLQGKCHRKMLQVFAGSKHKPTSGAKFVFRWWFSVRLFHTYSERAICHQGCGWCALHAMALVAIEVCTCARGISCGLGRGLPAGLQPDRQRVREGRGAVPGAWPPEQYAIKVVGGVTYMPQHWSQLRCAPACKECAAVLPDARQWAYSLTANGFMRAEELDELCRERDTLSNKPSRLCALSINIHSLDEGTEWQIWLFSSMDEKMFVVTGTRR